jgi:hypothetical protein
VSEAGLVSDLRTAKVFTRALTLRDFQALAQPLALFSDAVRFSRRLSTFPMFFLCDHGLVLSIRLSVLLLKDEPVMWATLCDTDSFL